MQTFQISDLAYRRIDHFRDYIVSCFFASIKSL